MDYPPHLQERFHQPHPYPESFHDLDLADDVIHHHPYRHSDHFPGYSYRTDQFREPYPTLSYERLGHHHHPLAYAHDNHLDNLTGIFANSSLSGYGVPMPLGGRDALYPAHHFNGYDPLLADSYYRHMDDILPHDLPMFSDPYAFGYRGGSMGGHGLGTGIGYDAMRDPFVYGIDHDYGYGHLPPFSTYGLTPSAFTPAYGPILDDLYLFELMLRSDHLLSERERLRRWEERLQWEELNEIERANRWRQMDLMRRTELGLGRGSYWGCQLGGFPLDPTLGYTHPLIRQGHLAFPGTAHYPLSSSLAMRYPMWRLGGLGVGRRILGWHLKPKHILRQAERRLDYAERRGEIPPRPRILGPGLMGTGVPGMIPQMAYGF